MIPRIIQQEIEKNLFKNKVLLLIGARQIGKTTLLKQVLQNCTEKSLWLNADESDIKRKLENATTSTQLLQLFGNAKLIVIDEAQQVEDIGLKLKLVIDTNPELQIIATGSSAFELLQKSNEPLTGRKKEYHLYPISFSEMVRHTSLLTEQRLLENRLIYGSYPEVINNPGNEKEVLKEITNSYLYKDVLRYDGIKKASLIDKLLVALALQVGSEVSYNELAKTIGNINSTTVEKYIDLLEKAFVIYKLPALSRNLRNEIKKGKKIYFYDNGIRNAIINNFNPLALRNDKGALWENFLISERMKKNSYAKHYCNTYFWRTFDQAEVDYIEEYDGALHVFEFKWKTNNKKVPASLLNSYTVNSTAIVDTDNYEGFVVDL
jgi:predicted AAA+ superfamily ATPase